MATMRNIPAFGEIPKANKHVELQKISPEILKSLEEGEKELRVAFKTVLDDLLKVEETEGAVSEDSPRRRVADLYAAQYAFVKEELDQYKAN
jgi:hypothetical protein